MNKFCVIRNCEKPILFLLVNKHRLCCMQLQIEVCCGLFVHLDGFMNSFVNYVGIYRHWSCL
jgi:hypothetical protein